MGNLEVLPEFDEQGNTKNQNLNVDGEDPPKKPGSKAQGRKRTKTGCLTCRRRRIKCGEERPACQNCAKSKRQCEGYNQRVVFKDPSNTYRPSFAGSSSISFSGLSAVHHGESYQQPRAKQNPIPIASSISPDAATMSVLPVTAPETERTTYGFPGGPIQEQQRSNLTAQHFDKTLDSIGQSYLLKSTNRQSSQDLASHFDFDALKPLVKQENRDNLPPTTQPQISLLDSSAGTISASKSPPQELVYNSHTGFPVSAAFNQSYLTALNWGSTLSVDESFPTLIPATLDSRTTLQYYSIEDDDGLYDFSDGDLEMEEDDNYKREQDGTQDITLKNNDLGIVVALQARQNTQDFSPHSFTSLIGRPDMLATYVAFPQFSPLRDSMTAGIFCHFVNVTGPSISMFERHPANPSLIFQGKSVPKSQQHIWTYTFPTLALQNPALLHAILALASLHIAKLQNGPIIASLKHYAISLRRVAKYVSLPTRRGQPATLAAAMLLAFYELWLADHQKWSNHLLGAEQLLREIDFVGMTRKIRSVKIQQRREERASFHQAQQLGHGFYEETSRYQTDDVDENIVGMLMGKKLSYDQYGQILGDCVPDDYRTKVYTERDLEIYETQRDLFWWYCKQDVYQSILGGGRLLMEYALWAHCPPRAPLGRLNAAYGTFDHLILLMGRLADFAANDLKRKRLAMKANNGQWRPPQFMQMAQPMPSSPQGPPALFPQITPQPPQMPLFSGMVPGVGEPELPMGFTPSRDKSPQSTQSDDIDLNAKKIEAEEEWGDIRNAFNILEDHFGEDFQALDPEFSAPIQTPFGTALQYRTYGIAGIWMNYYTALISCYRSHPSMPPAAMMAVGIQAQQTAFFANEIGRIAAGLALDCNRITQVNPGVGAALIESATCLFVAGVQYQNLAQRNWTISRLQDIARLTGWQTAHAIAVACETSWVKTAALGRGPPYTQVEVGLKAPDIWSSSRRIDRAVYRVDKEKKPGIAGSERFPEALGCQESGTNESGANVSDQYHQANPENTQGRDMTNTVREVVEQKHVWSLKYMLSNFATSAQTLWQWEAKIPDGKIRVRWKCKCGQLMYDDFEERQTGAARRLESSLNSRLTNSNASANSSNGSGKSGSIIATFVSNSIQNLRKILGGKGAKLPQHAPQTVPGTQSPYNPPAPPTETLYLLLCHNEGIYATKLLQLPIADLESDNQLFRVLLSQYKSMRGQLRSFISFRTLTSIRFVRFEMYKKSHSVDIRKTDDIPPADHAEYKYAPVPIDIIPPVGENQLMHFFHHPEHAEDEPVCLDRFPKKRRERFAVCNGRATEIGWGLHLVEGWDSRKTWVVCFVLFGFGSSLWGILWTVFKKSIQDAFAVAGFTVALAVLTVGFIQSMTETMNR